MAEDYPRTLLELERRFSTEQACREYLFDLRWPDGFRCPRCEGGKSWALQSGRVQCAGCGYQVSMTAGTVFQDTRTPLTVWFRAMWWLTSQKNGVSAVGLQRVLGWGSYQTAWTCLHKLRRAMIRPGRERLAGVVEVDESYLGGDEQGVHGRHIAGKALVVLAAEEDGRGIGRIRLRHIQDASAARLIPFIEDSIQPGSTVHTDGWYGYLPLRTAAYQHRISNQKGHSERASELLPRVHQVFSLLNFNRRRSRSRGKLFYRLVQQAVATEPTTYRQIVDSAIKQK